MLSCETISPLSNIVYFDIVIIMCDLVFFFQIKFFLRKKAYISALFHAQRFMSTLAPINATPSCINIMRLVTNPFLAE